MTDHVKTDFKSEIERYCEKSNSKKKDMADVCIMDFKKKLKEKKTYKRDTLETKHS